MIVILRDLYSLFWDMLGYWWMGTQRPSSPVAPTTTPPVASAFTEFNDETDWEDDGSPLPAATGSDKPACVSCGDPNFSLESEFCISCRVGMS